jgi:glycosyltransferase involved in cell wall biosynthesis
MSLLSVVIPCFNEAEAIEHSYRAIKDMLASLTDFSHEIILVDDGSADGTLAKLNEIMARDQTVRVLALSRNFGHQIALAAGLDAAIGDAVVMMDADLQHPPSLVPQLVASWRRGADVVSAIREATDGESWFKSTTSRGFYRILNALSSTKVPPGAADFCLLSRRVCDALKNMPERHRFLRGLVSWVGYTRAYVPYVAPQRVLGKTKYSFVRMLTLALDAVFSFSAEPLRLALRTGIVIALGGFLYLAWTLVYGYIVRGLVPGYASLIGVTLILGGFQLMFIGLIGQYLARVFEEVKGRPLYLLTQNTPPRSTRATQTV